MKLQGSEDAGLRWKYLVWVDALIMCLKREARGEEREDIFIHNCILVSPPVMLLYLWLMKLKLD